MGKHTRRSGEYVRPGRRILLDDYFLASGEFFASGTYYQQDALSGFRVAQNVEAELVPEPHNPWDARAIALDVEGQRAAYLPAVSAKMWYDVVRGWNDAGFAVYCRAEINRWDGDDGDDGEGRFGLTVPKWEWETLVTLAEAVGLRAAWETALADLTEAQRLLLRWDGGYSPDESVVRAMYVKRAQHPVFRWGAKGDGDLTERMPFWYGYFVREQMRQEKELLRFAHSVRSGMLRAFKGEIKRGRERERQQALLLRQEQDERALRLQRQGRRVSDIAAEAGLSFKQVETALSRARRAAGVTARSNEGLQSARRRDAAEAVRLKESGMARAQIARAMGRSADTVDELLKDGLFYEAPEEHPERLALARQCSGLRTTGLGKAKILEQLGVSRKQALRAFRDSSFLDIVE
ncbi:hypothetical protein ACFWWM_43200 [Streptomyces sp. NPDC058682]|uniref:hypothetical protein n=1 Tax=Streptomyces sp. NPDC058682 TaxID=3346596 RepID=UPI003656389F